MIATILALVPRYSVLAAFVLLLPSPTPRPLAQDVVLRVVSGTTDTGDATAQWLAMLRKRLSPTEYDSVARLRTRETVDEKAWAVLIQSRTATWEREIPALAKPFDPVSPPGRVLIVLGDRGGGDAFTHDPTTIGFDLAELVGNYGSAALPENVALMDRLFRHEFTHLLQKAWLPTHPWNANSPLRAALLDIWQEGLGNYYSLSERWRNQNGQRPAATQRALADLEPRFVARLSALACVEPDNAARLLAGISSGPFDHKWGAVPVALWLDDDNAASATSLRNLVVAGPAGIWDLANRHLSEPLRRVLTEARIADSLCAKTDKGPGSSRGRARSAAADSEAVAIAIANSLLLDSRGSADQRGPAVFVIPADAGGARGAAGA
jgi:hypothetical protein